jgi:arylsulfatase A-like enzyme
MGDVFMSKTKEFIKKNRDKPFFLYYAAHNVHVPRVPNPRFRGKSKTGFRGDSMVEFDWSTGEIIQALKDNGVYENTIIVFSSDNGPVYDDGYDDGCKVYTSTKEVDQGHDASGPYRGGKYQIFEGGTRVPLIVSWPGVIKPGVSDALISQVDFLASFATLVGVKVPVSDATDSRNSLGTILGRNKTGSDFIIEEAWGLAIRKGPWKLIELRRKRGTQWKLYNLDKDIMEQKNIANQYPEIVKSLKKVIVDVKAGKMLRNLWGVRVASSF